MDDMPNLSEAECKALTGEAVRMGKHLELRAILVSTTRYGLQKRGLIDGRNFSQKLTPKGEKLREELLKGRP